MSIILHVEAECQKCGFEGSFQDVMHHDCSETCLS